MPNNSLHDVTIFRNDKITAFLEHVTELQEKAQNGAYETGFDVSAGGADLKLPDDISMKASLTAKAEIFEAGKPPRNPFGTAEELTLPANKTVWSRFEVDLEGSISGKVSAKPAAGVSISVGASAGRGLRYQILRPQSGEWTRIRVIRDLLRVSQLPGSVNLAGLPPGNIHSLQGKYDYSLDLKFDAGYSAKASIVGQLFSGVSPTLELKGAAVVGASLGLSGYGRKTLVVGRAASFQAGADRIRIRLERERQRRFTFAARMSVQFDWDLGSSLEKILDEAFDSFDLPDFVVSMQEIVDAAAAGDWDQIQGKISSRAKGVLRDAWEKSDLDEWLADSDTLEEVTEFAKTVVDTFNSIDDEVESWWGHFLQALRVDDELEKVNSLLDRVIALESESLVDRVREALAGNDDASKLVDLVEMFSGKSLEDVLLAPDAKLEVIVTTTVDLAKKMRRFTTELPAVILSRIKEFAERAGVSNVIKALAQHGTSPEAVSDYLKGRVEGLAERVVGKAFAEFDQADRKMAQQWAKKAQEALNLPQVIEKRIKDTVGRLKGSLGFSISIEIDRLERHSALLDLEVDVSAKALLKKISIELQSGDVARVLALLADVDSAGKEPDEKDPKAFLREAVFASSRVRTTALSIFASISGLGKGESSKKRTWQRYDESTIRVKQLSTHTFERLGTYSGGFSFARMQGKNEDRIGLILENDLKGVGPDIYAEYTSREQELRITFSRKDTETSLRELRCIDQMAMVLGLTSDRSAEGLDEGCLTEFSLELRLGLDSLETLLKDVGTDGDEESDAKWDLAYLNAAHRYFAEPLIDREVWIQPTHSFHKVNQLLPNTLMVSRVQKAMRHKSAKGFLDDTENVRIPIPGGFLQMSLREQPNKIQYKQPFGLLKNVMKKRRKGLRAMRRLDTSATTAGIPTHATITELSFQFARAARRTSVTQGTWPSVLFPLWWVLSKTAHSDPEALEGVSGMAVLKWKHENDEEFGPPIVWQLEKPMLDPMEIIFPISSI